MTKLRVLDLFSGIGGMSLGLERTGNFETIAFCEIDQYASKVLGKWWPHVPNFTHGIVGLNSLLRRVRTASRPDFLVRISHSLAQAPDLPGLARDSFGHSCEPFAWYDQGSRSWRTWQRCLVEGWETFSGTWPRSGMTRNGIAYRRAPLVHLIGETVSGSLLPTPTATANMMAPSMQKWAAHANLFPTPMAADARGSSGQNREGKQFQLVDYVKAWPTPTATLGTKGGRITPRKGREGGTLIEAVAKSQETHDRNSRPLSEQVGGSLNPTWVEWLMGFPIGWTDLGASGTPSSRKSSSSKRLSSTTTQTVEAAP